MEQAEGISVEELQYRMLSKGDSADDYHAHLQKMKIKQIYLFRKKGTDYCFYLDIGILSNIFILINI